MEVIFCVETALRASVFLQKNARAGISLCPSKTYNALIWYLVRREAARLSYLLQDVLGVDTKERDGGELAAHVLERVAAVIDAVVNNQPAVMRRVLPDECRSRKCVRSLPE